MVDAPSLRVKSLPLALLLAVTSVSSTSGRVASADAATVPSTMSTGGHDEAAEALRRAVVDGGDAQRAAPAVDALLADGLATRAEA